MNFLHFNFGDGWLSWRTRLLSLAIILLTWLLQNLLDVSLFFPWAFLLVIAVGLAEALQRIQINLSKREIVVARPLVPWVPVRTLQAASYDTVCWEKTKATSKNRWITINKRTGVPLENWHLQLEGPEVEPFVLKRFSEEASMAFEAKLEREAKRIAGRMELGYRMKRDDLVIEQEAGTLHESLREWAERTGGLSETPRIESKLDLNDPPGRIQVSTEDDVLELTFQVVDSPLFRAIAIGGVVSIVGFGVLGMVISPAEYGDTIPSEGAPIFSPSWRAYNPVVLILWPTISIGLNYLMANIVERVRISPRDLSWRRTSGFGVFDQSRTISAEELQHVEIAKPIEPAFWENDRKKVVMIRGEDTFFHFGSSLNGIERRWVRDLIVYLMSMPSAADANEGEVP